MRRMAPPRNAVDGREAVRKGGIGAKPLALGRSPKRSESIPPTATELRGDEYKERMRLGLGFWRGELMAHLLRIIKPA
ncbi:MAG: hypothetical protein RL598_929 [Verrucomicrobiota bacterium]|jgi:hypothetical protein